MLCKLFKKLKKSLSKSHVFEEVLKESLVDEGVSQPKGASSPPDKAKGEVFNSKPGENSSILIDPVVGSLELDVGGSIPIIRKPLVCEDEGVLLTVSEIVPPSKTGCFKMELSDNLLSMW